MLKERCEYCGKIRGLAEHHITFRSQGGGDEDVNLVTLCNSCHHKIHVIKEKRILAWIEGIAKKNQVESTVKEVVFDIISDEDVTDRQIIEVFIWVFKATVDPHDYLSFDLTELFERRTGFVPSCIGEQILDEVSALLDSENYEEACLDGLTRTILISACIEMVEYFTFTNYKYLYHNWNWEDYKGEDNEL